MDSIRIKRLRSLSDTGHVEIKPITVLLGQNSSGKSTFLRLLPLLKQSAESRTTGPILWYGRLVDFGSFEDAHQNGSEDTISFSFKFCIGQGPFLLSTEYESRLHRLRILHDLNINLTLEIAENQKKEITRTSKLTLFFQDSKIQLDFDENENVSSFYVNNLDILKLGKQYISRTFGDRFLLPIISELEQSRDSSQKSIGFPYDLPIRRSQPSRSSLWKLLFKAVKDKVHHATSNETIAEMLMTFGIGNSEEMLKDFKHSRFLDSWKKQVSDWDLEIGEFNYLRNLLIANSASSLISICDDILARFSQSISYMGPVRATAERYYRTQNVAVDEVDYQGHNLTMFLRSLKDSEMKNFSEWTLDNFGFKPLIKSSLGHFSLKIRPKGAKRDLNIADTGFGFSQILPVITQLWLLSGSPKRHEGSIGSHLVARIPRRVARKKIPTTYAIEQPELHLHPRLQGLLTDVFTTSVKVAKDKGIDLRLVIETHSETLVNRLGHLVAEGRISPDLINIVLFEPSSESGEVIVSTSQFDSEGYLSNWPLGFFEMDLL